MNSSFGWFVLKSVAFLRRDLLFETSYKLQSVFRLLAIFFQVMTFYFLARLIDGDASAEHLERFGGDYFSYALIGIAFMGFFNAGLISFTVAMRQQLVAGVLEAMAAAPMHAVSLLFYSMLWPLGFELVKALLFLVIGRVFFGAQIALSNWPLFLGTLALSLLVFGGLGIIAGSLIVFFKRGDPVAWIISSLTTLTAGVLFPITLLPSWLQIVAHCIPVTYALEALRGTLIPGADTGEIGRNCLILSLFALVLLPAAFVSAHVVFEKARERGNLGTY